MNNFIIQPQKIIIKGIEWTLDEIRELKNIYSGRPFVEFEKSQLRSNPLLQKALKCEIIMSTTLQKGDTAILHLAQIGYDLMDFLK